MFIYEVFSNPRYVFVSNDTIRLTKSYYGDTREMEYLCTKPSKSLIRVECFVFRQRNPLLTLEKWHECVLAVTSF
jgi:hypothetical protein